MNEERPLCRAVSFCSQSLIWIVAAALSALVALLSLAGYDVFNPDVTGRYALMAEAFSRGDWFYAFHPRFALLFPLLTGIVAKVSGLGGMQVCQIVGALFMGLTMVSLWHLMRRVFDEGVAWLSVLLTLAVPEFVGNAMNGLRDDARSFGVSLWALGIVNRSAAWQSVALAVLATVKIDCLAPAWVMGAISLVIAVRNRDWRCATFPLVALLASTLAVCAMNFAYTGWFVPAPQYIKLLGGTVR